MVSKVVFKDEIHIFVKFKLENCEGTSKDAAMQVYIDKVKVLIGKYGL